MRSRANIRAAISVSFTDLLAARNFRFAEICSVCGVNSKRSNFFVSSTKASSPRVRTSAIMVLTIASTSLSCSRFRQAFSQMPVQNFHRENQDELPSGLLQLFSSRDQFWVLGAWRGFPCSVHVRELSFNTFRSIDNACQRKNQINDLSSTGASSI